ncbi:MAG: ribosomal protein S18-alanine N-acetyltransferase [Patescibacteria group bacterium]
MIQVRKFSLGDLHAIRKIEKESLFDGSPRPLERYFQKYPDEFMVAQQDEKILGYIIGRTKDNGSARIAWLAVLPSCRGKGVGRKLLEYLLNHFEDRGIKKVFLFVRTHNTPAISLYEKVGFTILRKVEKYYRNGNDAFVMRKFMDA